MNILTESYEEALGTGRSEGSTLLPTKQQSNW